VEVFEWLPKLARPGDESQGVRRLLQHLRRVEFELYGLIFDPCSPTRFHAQSTGFFRFLAKNDTIVQPLRVTGGGVLQTSNGNYRLIPKPNARTLLRLQAAVLTHETLVVPYEVRRIEAVPRERLEDLLIAVYALREGTTVLRVRRGFRMVLRGPSRPSKRLHRPLESMLLALPINVAVSVLKDPLPNLEMRTLTAWLAVKGWGLRRTARRFAVSERTLRRWQAIPMRYNPLRLAAAAVSEADLRAVLTDPDSFRVKGTQKQP
jgi:hypothetical protein